MIEESCVEDHSEYIKNKYDAETEWSKETNEIKLDPGGMMTLNGAKTSFKSSDGCEFTINNEHILPMVEYYFSLDLLIDASERKASGLDDKGYTVRIIKDDMVKVYQPFMILVMRADTYMDIAASMEKLYLKGLYAYFDLAASLPDEYFESILLESIVGSEIAEA